jgi:hypothetical protein
MRLPTGLAHRFWLLAGGIAVTAEAIAAIARQTGGPVRLSIAVLAVVLAVAVWAIAVRGIGNRVAPGRARVLDVLDLVLGVAAIPVIVELLGLYARVRSLMG